MLSIDSIETYACGTSKDLVNEKEEIKCKNIIKRYKKRLTWWCYKRKERIANWPQIPDHPYRILIIGGTGPGQKNSLFSLINQQPDINKTYLHAEDLYEAKYQFLLNINESKAKSILMI